MNSPAYLAIETAGFELLHFGDFVRLVRYRVSAQEMWPRFISHLGGDVLVSQSCRVYLEAIKDEVRIIRWLRWPVGVRVDGSVGGVKWPRLRQGRSLHRKSFRG